MMRPICLVALLPALFFGACLLEPKTGCRITDDCAPGRVCVAGTCQRPGHDAGLDARSDRQSSTDGAINPSETQSPDLAGGPDGAQVVDAAPDAPAMIDAPNGPAGLDASPEKQFSGDVASPDPAAAPDMAPQVADAAPDAPTAVAIDAPDSQAGLDASSDGQPTQHVAIDSSSDLPSGPDTVPDSAALPTDAASDAPSAPTIDAPLSSDVPQSGIDASAAGCDGISLPPNAVSWEDFRAQSPREPWIGGRYIVDGDLALDEAGLRRYYDAWFAAVGVAPENLAPMGATAVWLSPDSFFLSYCISTAFGANFAAVEAAMLAATASWSDRVGVEYTYVPEENANCNADNTNVTFDIRPVSGAGYAAVSFFPDSPRPARSLLVDTTAFAAAAGSVDLEATLRHQLGHTLGFQHERLWLNPACTSEDSRLAVKIANYDIDSVMHLPACRPSELGGTIQTEGDLVGAIAIYGLSPALIVVNAL